MEGKDLYCFKFGFGFIVVCILVGAFLESMHALGVVALSIARKVELLHWWGAFRGLCGAGDFCAFLMGAFNEPRVLRPLQIGSRLAFRCKPD